MRTTHILLTHTRDVSCIPEITALYRASRGGIHHPPTQEKLVRKNLASLFFLVLVAASAFGKSKLEGVWQTVEVKTLVGSKPGTFTKEPGVLIFTEKHYSLMIPLSDTRTQIDQGKGTAEEW